MKGRRSPIDRMRELADDGLEPWQIAAALGVREDAVLVALAADEPAGGAQRAVEDASSLVPAKPDTLAPTRPLRAALVEHVADLADRADGIAQDMTAALGLPEGLRLAFDTTPIGPAPGPIEAYLDQERAAYLVADFTQYTEPAADDPPEFDAVDPSTYPCATGRDCGCADTGLLTCPGRDENRVEDARRARDKAADRFLDALAVANSATAAELEARLDEPDPEHVHDPFPVVDETGVWHAECECGTRWDRSPCEYSGCTAYVAALHIARTGTSRHAHHPPA